MNFVKLCAPENDRSVVRTPIVIFLIMACPTAVDTRPLTISNGRDWIGGTCAAYARFVEFSIVVDRVAAIARLGKRHTMSPFDDLLLYLLSHKKNERAAVNRGSSIST